MKTNGFFMRFVQNSLGKMRFSPIWAQMICENQYFYLVKIVLYYIFTTTESAEDSVYLVCPLSFLRVR